jgi:uncharacterized protein YecT (DUF1311 family)
MEIAVKTLIAILLVLAAPVAAQIAPQIDCMASDLTAPEYRFCATQAYEEADAELNQVYRLAIARAQVFDQEVAVLDQSGPITLEEALRQSQRDWIAFRNSACEAEAVIFRDGTDAPVVGTICLARRTIERTEELRTFASDL